MAHARSPLDPSLKPSPHGNIHGLSAHDVPAGCDMSIMPKGDPLKFDRKKVYVVWEGRETGLFWSWDDAANAVNFYSGARHKWYKGLEKARIAFYLGDPATSRRAAPATQASASSRTANARGRPAQGDETTSTAPDDETTSVAPDDHVNNESHANPFARATRTTEDGRATPKPQGRPDYRSDANVPGSNESAYFSFSGPPTSPSVASSQRTSTTRTMSSFDDVEIVDVSSSDEEDDDWVYVVVRGRKPGVYPSRRNAVANLGKSSKRSMRASPSLDQANSAFVRYYMSGQVACLSK